MRGGIDVELTELDRPAPLRRLGTGVTAMLRRARHLRMGAVVTALGLLASAVIAAFARWGPDWPAQEFRAWSAAHDGLTAWTNRWYSGQALPGYSVLYPVFSAYLGAAATGFVAVAVATAGARRFAPASGPARLGFQISVAVILASDLLIGQVPYLVGVAFGVWALDAALNGRSLLGAVLAAGCALSSPLAGLFLLVAIPALASARGWRRSTSLLTAVIGLVVGGAFGGAHGPGPFTTAVLLAAAGVTALLTGLALAAGQEYRPIAIFGATLALAIAMSCLVANPVGGNIARLSQLAVLPLLWHVAPATRLPRRLIAGLIVLAALWPSAPAVTAVVRGATDPSQNASYYTGLVRFLHGEDARRGRLEVVFTREHWEASWVARAFPIARGWERQTDLQVNSVLYRPLSEVSYRRWLDDNAVFLVALPTASLDEGGRAEARLLRHPPAYLQPAWHDAHWQVWRVRAAHPLVTGPAEITDLGADSVSMNFRRPGTATVRIRDDRMWSVSRGSACLDKSGPWLRVRARVAGRVRLDARVELPLVGHRAGCT